MSLRPLRMPVRRAHQLAAGRAVGELFEQYGRMVHALCRLNLRDRLDAEDATQQTFLSAHRSILRGIEPNDPPAWLATIARNECSRVRKRRVSTVPMDDSEGTAVGDLTGAVEQREEIAALAVALSELAPAQRDAVVLREFYGLSYKEVAAVLGVSDGAVESLLFKGRRRLQTKLGSLRVASAVVLPDALREALAQALPGFGGGAAVGAKVIAFPGAAKVAALALAITGGGVAVAETVERDARRPTASNVARAADSAAQPAASDRDFRPRASPTAAPLAQRSSVVRRIQTRPAPRKEDRDVALTADLRQQEDEEIEEVEELEEPEPKDDEVEEQPEQVAKVDRSGPGAGLAAREDERDDDTEDDDTEGPDADDTPDD